MNKYLRGLLSGASFAALNFGMFAGTARASGTHVAGAHASSVAVHGVHDFIWVDPGAVVQDGLFNFGSIGPNVGAAGAGIEVNGTVDAALFNLDQIQVTGPNWGIEVKTAAGQPASVSSGIFNSGLITVTDNGTGGGGIHVTANARATGFYNFGDVQINGSGGRGISLSQRASITHAAVRLSFNNYTGNHFNVTDHVFNAGATTSTAARLAGGLSVLNENVQNTHIGSGSARAAMGNLGVITLNASASVSDNNVATVHALIGSLGHPAIRQNAQGFHAQAQLQNNGTLKILASAKARAGQSATGLADIFGIGQHAQGQAVTAASRNAASVNLHDSGHGIVLVKAHASALATGTKTTTQPLSVTVYNHTSHLTGGFPGSSSPGHITFGPGTIGGHLTTTGPGTLFVAGAPTSHLTGAYNNPSTPGHLTPGGGYTATGHLSQTGTNTFHHGGVAIAHAGVRDGLLQQVSHAGHLTANFTVGHTAHFTVSAVAIAKHTAAGTQQDGSGFADAHIQAGIRQAAIFGTTAKLTIQNNGHLKINIAASASAITGNATALAWQKRGSSSVHQGLIDQSAYHVGNATEFLGNNGVMKITAAAMAVAGTGRAHAVASGGSRIQTNTSFGLVIGRFVDNGIHPGAGLNGIRQFVSDVHIANLDIHNHLGTLDIEAAALAMGGSSDVALARIGDGIRQVAGTTGSSIVTAHLGITNDGSMEIAARGIAAGSGLRVDGRVNIEAGIKQTAIASHAHVSLDNAVFPTSTGTRVGKISILATAGGVSTSLSSHRAGIAMALGQIGKGIDQAARGSGTAVVDNHGVILIRALASAVARNSAQASATISLGILQAAYGGAAGLAKITNADNLTIQARATANGFSHATAKAAIWSGISQSVQGTGHATAKLSNTATGHLKIQAQADAYFTFTGTAPGARDASATAVIRHGISQIAGTDTRPGAAKALLTNHGHITITASARASATQQATALARAGFAETSHGFVTSTGYAVRQFASGAAHALAKIDNDGTLKILANAGASRVAGIGQQNHAKATLLGIQQSAEASTANASIINRSGAHFTLSAQAYATGSDAHATANAGLYHRHVSRTTQTNIITRGGTPIGASFTHRTTNTGVTVNYAIVQKADFIAGPAVAKIDNSGTFKILARASAGTGTAKAAIFGIQQAATGVTGSVLVTNAAGAHLTLSAAAQGSGDHANAVARMGTVHNYELFSTRSGGSSFYRANIATNTVREYAISQHAVGTVHGALAAIDNSGTFKILAQAQAHAAGAASASATLVGIRQYAGHAHSSGSVTARLDNRAGGLLQFKAKASALGGGAALASAHAGVSSALRQTVTQASSAHAILANAHLADITISAIASAKPGETSLQSAQAEAWLGHPLQQQAGHFDTAQLDIENSGIIRLNAAAKASGTGASVTALAYQKYVRSSSAAGHGAMIYQAGAHGVSAQETLHNQGSILIREHAEAMNILGSAIAIAGAGTNRQDVRGRISADISSQPGLHGIQQSGQSVDQAIFHVTNSGVLGIAASATALGANHAVAHADIATAIAQFAVNNVPGATLSIYNAAHAQLSITAKATAQGLQATADARLAHGIAQFASGAHTHILNLTNAGYVGLNAIARASGTAGAATARLSAGISQRANGSVAQAHLNNSGTLVMAASAHAPGLKAYASADGVQQSAQGGDAAAALVNSGVLQVSGIAHGGRQVQADVHIILQDAAVIAGPAHVSFINHHDVTGLASAGGTATRASPHAFISGVKQFANGQSSATAQALVRNDGNFVIQAQASAHGDSHGVLFAQAFGVLQRGSSTGIHKLTVENSGHVLVSASALDHGAAGLISARAAGFVFDVEGAIATAHFSNAVHGSVTVKAFAKGPVALASAVGVGAAGRGSHYTGVSSRNGSRTNSSAHLRSAAMELDIVNAGSLKVLATASGGALSAKARATGVAFAVTNQTAQFRTQTTSGGPSSRSHSTARFQAVSAPGHIVNSGNFLVAAKAAAGDAQALGIAITAHADYVSISNAGHLTVAATGKTATATGLRIRNRQDRTSRDQHRTTGGSTNVSHTTTSYVGAQIVGKIENDGTFKVSAEAGAGAALARGIVLKESGDAALLKNTGHITVAATGAQAAASGIRLSNTTTAKFHRHTSFAGGGGSTSTGTSHSLADSLVSGTIENDGSIKVTAKAVGAVAKGIVIDAARFGGSIINKGIIAVEADGAGGQAVAIEVTNHVISKAPPPPGSIINNGGTISAKLVNGGVTSWGTAIDVSNAPGAMAIGLTGNGNIYGNLKLKSNSAVTVSGSGVTFFSGIINPSKTKAGTITIAAGGNLELANDAAQGNAKAYVTSFSQLGTLSVDIGSVGNTTPYINAGTATLAGALVVVPGSVLPAASSVYRIVLSDAALATTWSGVSIKGAPALLTATATYLPNEADVSISVTPSDVVAQTLGLTPNQLAILTPVEKDLANLLTTASIDPNSALGKLVTALFTLTAPQLAGVLDQLGNQDVGAQTQNSLSFATALLDQILNHLGQGATGGGAFASAMPAGVRPAQLTTGTGTVWGGLYGAHASTRAAGGVPGSSTSLTGLYAGYDLALDTDLLVGAAVAYSTDTSKTGSPGGHGSANGFQISPYLRLTRDSGFFANADVSYGIYTNKLSRTLSIPGFGSGTNTGKFNSNVFSGYLEAGQNYANGSLTLSPYAALAYARGDSGAYTETGLAGTLLHVNSASAQTLTSYLGVGLSHVFDLDDGGRLTPRMRFAWAHDYSGSAWSVNAALAALPGSGFAIRGPGLSREKAYINVALDLHLSDEVETSLNYDALFNNDQSQQSLMGVLRFSF